MSTFDVAAIGVGHDARVNAIVQADRSGDSYEDTTLKDPRCASLDPDVVGPPFTISSWFFHFYL
jgi:hypothetical protein